MSHMRFLICFSIFFFGCATSRPATVASVAPVSVAAAPKIVMQAPEGWSQTLALSDGKDLIGMEFTQARTKATIFFRILPSEGKSADIMAAYVAWQHGVSGRMVYGIERAINGRTLATAMWRGTKAEKSIEGEFGVRSVKERPEIILVINAKWPKGTPKDVLEEIDLMILLATIE